MVETNYPYASKHWADRSRETNHKFTLRPIGNLEESEQLDELKMPKFRVANFLLGKQHPREIVKRVHGMSKDELASHHADFQKNKPAKGSPQDLQARSTSKELKRRGTHATMDRSRFVKRSLHEVVRETIHEAVTRKHFQQVADVIKAHPDAAKRKELATHHAGIFATQNPRFDKKRFFAAANAN